AHFIAIKTGMLVPKLAEIYIEQIVKLHGIPSSIVSDRDPRWTIREDNPILGGFVEGVCARARHKLGFVLAID
ncbi:retrotransposon protein, partial [Trifolium medium]|nr:retrotransposon protein [Trifolium medium]